jgi:CRP-like cAMP-binding protein
MYTELLSAFKGIVNLEAYEEQLIKDLFKPHEIGKGRHFLRSGRVNNYIGFLKKGLVRYYINKNGQKATIEFTDEGEFVADYQSFMSREASGQNIEAIENCQMLVIDYDGLQQIYSETRNGNLLGRVIIEHRYNIIVKKLLSLYVDTPEDRYKHFIEKYSNIGQRIPQYLVASYIGVQPQSLSRIRKRLAKQISLKAYLSKEALSNP